MNPPEYTETPVVQPVYPPHPQQPPPPEMNPNVGQAYIVNQPPQVGYVNGCGQVFYACSPAPVVYTNYRARQSKFLGIAQIIIGILSIAFNATSIGVSNYYDSGLSFVGIGIWAGIFFIITGSFGIAAGAGKSRCLIITFMVFCIISSVAALIILILSAISVALTASECYNGGYYYDSYGFYRNSYQRTCPYQHDARLAMYCVLLILSVFEGICALWGSIICCKVACCGARNQNPYTIQPQPVMFGSAMNGNQQVIILTNANMPSQNGVTVYPVAAAPLSPTAPGGTLNYGVPAPQYQAAPQPGNLIVGDMNSNIQEKQGMPQ